MIKNIISYTSVVIFIFCFTCSLKGETESGSNFIILKPLYGQNKLMVELDFKKQSIDPDAIQEIELKLSSSDVTRLIEGRKFKPIVFLKDKIFWTIFDMKNISAGTYQIEVELGGIGQKWSKDFSWRPKELEKFNWLDSKAGETSEVLPPWTPVEVEHLKQKRGLNVRIWNRTYRFNDSPFPAAIETRGESILAGPIQILAKVDGRDVNWQWNSFEIEKQLPNTVHFNQSGTGEGLDLSATTQIEYDGMIRIDWKITSKQHLKLEKLIFEIPMKVKHAKYIYKYYDETRVGFIPEHRQTIAFNPMIWLGDEERGLQWFCESELDWYNTRAGRRIEILSENSVVKLRLHMVDDAINMESGKRIDYGLGVPVMQPKDEVYELNYTFGLQATPVKPVIKDVWDYRIEHVGHVKSASGTGERFTNLLKPGGYYNLDDFAKNGVKTVAFHAHWTDTYGSTSTPYVEELKKLVKACHERGIQLLPYIGFMMSELDPAWPLFSEECLKLYLNEWDYTKRDTSPMPQQKFYDTCWRSVWQNYYADGIAKMMRDYDIDGVYLDSTENIFSGCRNILHGCGYINPDGSIIRTFSIFPNRNMMRRIYTIVKKYKPDGQINSHNSMQMLAPTISWATSYWTAEHLVLVFRLRGVSEDSPILERMPLDYFRTEFMGHQWGVPAEFLDLFSMITKKDMAMILLHDVPIRGWFSYPLWRLFDEFGRKESEWLPYWRNGEYVRLKSEGKDVYVSMYKHPANGILAIVSNLGVMKTDVEIQLNLEKLILEDVKLSAYHIGIWNNSLLESISMNNGAFDLYLAPETYKIIWVKKEVKK